MCPLVIVSKCVCVSTDVLVCDASNKYNANNNSNKTKTKNVSIDYHEMKSSGTIMQTS